MLAAIQLEYFFESVLYSHSVHFRYNAYGFFFTIIEVMYDHYVKFGKIQKV